MLSFLLCVQTCGFSADLNQHKWRSTGHNPKAPALQRFLCVGMIIKLMVNVNNYTFFFNIYYMYCVYSLIFFFQLIVKNIDKNINAAKQIEKKSMNDNINITSKTVFEWKQMILFIASFFAFTPFLACSTSTPRKTISYHSLKTKSNWGEGVHPKQ